MRRLLSLVTLGALALGQGACFLHEEAIRHYEQTYKSDTELLNKVMAPLGVEEPHGQVTIVIGAKFTEKLIRASLQPNTLTLSVATPGRAWHEEVKKPLRFENDVHLDAGKLDMAFSVSDLALRGDLITLKGKLEGHGALEATMKFFGVTAKRNLELSMRYEDVLQLHVERGANGWFLRLVGPPLKAHVDVQAPALRVAGHDLMNLKFARDVSYPVEEVSTWDLPLPAPETVHVGPTTLSLGLRNFSIGTHEGWLWIGADVVVGETIVPPDPKAASMPAAQTPAAPAATPVVPPVPAVKP